MKLCVSLFLVMFGLVATAQAETPLYLGAHFQWATPLAPNEFKDDAGSATGWGVLGGYKFDSHWAAEIGYDRFKFDDVDMTHSLASLGAVYRFSEGFIVPYARLALGYGENSFDQDGVETKRTFAGHIGGGAEFNFDLVTLYAGARLNFLGDTAGVEDASSVNLLVGLIIPSFGSGETKASTGTVAQETKPAVAAHAEHAASPVDSDNDGVTDDKDKCPGTPAGAKVNDYGCQEKEKAVVKINIEFAAGKTEVQSQYESEIEKLAEFMKEHPQTKVEIAGHTDNTGSAKINTALSQKRAQAVADVLVKKHGIEKKRVTAKGYGPSKPVADNNTEEGRQANRRVEAQISN